MINRREFIKNVGVVAGAAWLEFSYGWAEGAPAAKRRPNILLIVSDEESQLPSSERALIKVPNKDWLEKRGVTFLNFFCVTPQCTPARSSIQTGLYPHQTRQVTNTNKPYGLSFPAGTEYLAQTLKTKGYRTGYGGKWHLEGTHKETGIDEVTGHTNDLKQGDYFRGFLQRQDKRPWFYQAHFLNPHDIYAFNGIYEKEAATTKKKHGTDFAVAADEFLQRNPTLPLPTGWDSKIEGLPVPHGDWALPFGGEGAYERLDRAAKELYWRHYKSLYLTFFERLDGNVGALLDVLRKEHPDQLENTIIIYSSDHGDLCGNHEILKFKGPLPFDSQLHIPLLISGPGIPRGQQRNQLTSQVDLAATICDLAGCGAPNAGKSDARSLVPVLKDAAATGRKYVFCEYHYLGSVQPLRIIRSLEAKLSLHLTEQATVMFDLRADPNERINVAGKVEYAQLQATLADALRDWREKTGDPLLTNPPDFQGWKRLERAGGKKKGKVAAGEE